MPIKSFADTTTADIARGDNTKAARRIPQRVWTAARVRLDSLHTARTVSDLALPAWRLEPLKYTKPGFYSIRINDQFRVLFQFRDGDAYDVQVIDYHGR